MTDIYHHSTPVAHAAFRDNTEKQAMLGVNTIPARQKCVSCNGMRTVKTGFNTKRGFVCGMCHSPRRVS